MKEKEKSSLEDWKQSYCVIAQHMAVNHEMNQQKYNEMNYYRLQYKLHTPRNEVSFFVNQYMPRLDVVYLPT